MSSPGWRTNGIDIDTPRIVNEGNDVEKPKGQPTLVHRFDTHHGLLKRRLLSQNVGSLACPSVSRAREAFQPKEDRDEILQTAASILLWRRPTCQDHAHLPRRIQTLIATHFLLRTSLGVL